MKVINDRIWQYEISQKSLVHAYYFHNLTLSSNLNQKMVAFSKVSVLIWLKLVKCYCNCYLLASLQPVSLLSTDQF
jgi:hypothetical protein